MKKNPIDSRFQRDLKIQVQRHLSQGKAKLAWLERTILNKKNLQTLKDEFRKSREKLDRLKVKFKQYGEQANLYIEKNPKKALAMATAAGALAGTLWGSYRKRKSSSNPRP